MRPVPRHQAERASGRPRWERPRRRAAAAGAVAGFGAAFLGLQALPRGGSLLDRGVLELPFLVLAVALVYVGYWLLGCELDAHGVGRVAASSTVGLVGLLAVLVWLLPLAAGPAGGVLDLTADVGTVGASAGLLVGLESVRGPARAGAPSAHGADPRFEHFNRQLRHHLLNGTAVIKGHAELLVDADGSDPEAAAVIRSRADELADVARNVGTLGLAATGELPTAPIDVAPLLAGAVARVERERPRASIAVEGRSAGRVLGSAELGTAFGALLRAAVDAADDATVRVATVREPAVVEVRFDYEGAPAAGLGGATSPPTGELSLHLAETLVSAAAGRVVGRPATGIAVRLPAA